MICGAVKSQLRFETEKLKVKQHLGGSRVALVWNARIWVVGTGGGGTHMHLVTRAVGTRTLIWPFFLRRPRCPHSPRLGPASAGRDLCNHTAVLTLQPSGRSSFPQDPSQIPSGFSSYRAARVGFPWHSLPFALLVGGGQSFCQELISSLRSAGIFILSRSLLWQVASA